MLCCLLFCCLSGLNMFNMLYAPYVDTRVSTRNAPLEPLCWGDGEEWDILKLHDFLFVQFFWHVVISMKYFRRSLHDCFFNFDLLFAVLEFVFPAVFSCMIFFILCSPLTTLLITSLWSVPKELKRATLLSVSEGLKRATRVHGFHGRIQEF